MWEHIDCLLGDGFDNPGIRRLHFIASHVKDQHAHTNLVRLVEGLGFGDMITSVPLGSISWVARPSIMFGLLRRRRRDQCKHVFGADKIRLTEFWRNVFKSEQGLELRQLLSGLRDKTPEQLCTTIPVTIHGDAGPFSKRQSCTLLQWSCNFRPWQRH